MGVRRIIQILAGPGSLLATLVLAAVLFAAPHLLGGPVHGTPQAPEMAERGALKSQVRGLLKGREFARLEALAEELRTTSARTGSGVWKLTVLYAAIEEMAGIGRDDSDGWRKLTRLVRDWRDSAPKAPTPIVAEAIVLRQYAWAHRPRLIVQEASLQSVGSRFVASLTATRSFLERHRAVAGRDPHYHVVLAQLASALGEEPAEFLTVIEQGLAVAPDYYQLHFAGFDYFATSSTATLRDIEAFANLSIARTNRTDGLGLYARLYWHALSSLDRRLAVKPDLADRGKLRRGIDDVLARYPDSWNLNGLARLACLAGDREKTAELLARIPEGPVLKAWTSPRAFESCRDWARNG